MTMTDGKKMTTLLAAFATEAVQAVGVRVVVNSRAEIVREWADKIAEASNSALIERVKVLEEALEVAKEVIEGHFDDGCRECHEALATIDSALSNATGGEGYGSSRTESGGTASPKSDGLCKSDWRDLEACAPPCERGYIRVRSVTTYRWAPYKPDGVRQMHKAGRWQVIGEYGGWSNAELPERGEWMPYAPGAPSSEALSDSPAEGRASPLAQDEPPSTPSVDPGA